MNGSKHRSGSEKETAHGVKLDPIRQERSQNMDHSINPAQQHGFAAVNQVEKRFSMNQKAYPKQIGHWASVDEGSKLFDFLSPARGKGSVSPPVQAAPVKSYMKSKDSAFKSHHESSSKPQLGRGQSSPLPTLSPRITSQNTTMGNKKSRSSNSLKEPLRPASRAGKERKTYVKFNEVATSSQKPKVEAEKKSKSPPKPKLTDAEQLKIVIKEQFRKYDTNNDGIISRKEAALLLQQNVVDSNGPDIKVALDFILGKMDFDKDGRITYDEYEACVMREPLLQNCFGAQGLKLDGPDLK
eukprot:TRINITY_DN2354_c0_g1_i4.p1 TRINITY_DN2354_c0_g1~~TRINITY_DN2354_c0_g1_i4.p1  ORF type:complete len:298 (-),score=68.15 TRINITY_DN2354_c0_g1_i4:49-942(-)